MAHDLTAHVFREGFRRVLRARPGRPNARSGLTRGLVYALALCGLGFFSTPALADQDDTVSLPFTLCVLTSDGPGTPMSLSFSVPGGSSTACSQIGRDMGAAYDRQFQVRAFCYRGAGRQMVGGACS